MSVVLSFNSLPPFPQEKRDFDVFIVANYPTLGVVVWL